MNKPALKPAASKPAPKSPVAKDKQKPVAFFNYGHFTPEGEKVFASSTGFRIYENEYQTTTEKLLVKLAKENGGAVELDMRVRIVIHNDVPAELDTSKITIIKK